MTKIRTYFRHGTRESAFRHGAIAVLVMFLLNCVCAQAGIFNRVCAGALMLAGLGFGTAVFWHFGCSAAESLCRRYAGWKERRTAAGVFGGLLACIAVCAALYYTPSERIVGACDEGLYADTAVNLARTGGYALRAPILAEMSGVEKGVLLKSEPAAAQRGTKLQQTHPRYQIGLFLRGADRTDLTPQFPLGWPAILASAYATGGWPAFHTINFLLLILCAALTSLLALAWLGPVTALCTFALFLFFPLDVWAARSIFSEPALTLAWLLAIAGWRESKAAPVSGGIITGLAVGALLYLKIEATVVVAGLIGLWGWHWADRRSYVLASAYAGVAALGLAALAWRQFNQFYLADTFGTVSHKTLWGAAAAAAAFAWGVSRPELRKFLARRSREKRLLRQAAFGLLLVLAFYGAVLRSDPATPDSYYYWPAQKEIRSFREESFLRLTWYWQPWGLAAAALGTAALAYSVRKPWQTGLCGVGLLFLIGLSYDIRNNPIQPYAMRRYLPFAMPILILGAASVGRRAVNRFAPRALRRPWAAPAGQAALTAILLAGFIPINAAINRHVEFAGTQKAIASMAEHLPPRALVLVSESSVLAWLATPLQFAFGRECLILPQTIFTNAAFPALVERWAANGRQVYLLTEKGGVKWISHGTAEVLNPTSFDALETSYLFQSATERPEHVVSMKLNYHLIPLGDW